MAKRVIANKLYDTNQAELVAKCHNRISGYRTTIDGKPHDFQWTERDMNTVEIYRSSKGAWFICNVVYWLFGLLKQYEEFFPVDDNRILQIMRHENMINCIKKYFPKDIIDA